jgi:hypothetical protein
VRAVVAAALAKQGGSNTTAPRYAWAVGAQAFCLGSAALYTAPALEGPWTFAGNLFNQLAIDSQVRKPSGRIACKCCLPGPQLPKTAVLQPAMLPLLLPLAVCADCC